MEERKVYDMGDIETLYDELGEFLDYDVLEERLSEKGLHDYSLYFQKLWQEVYQKKMYVHQISVKLFVKVC